MLVKSLGRKIAFLLHKDFSVKRFEKRFAANRLKISFLCFILVTQCSNKHIKNFQIK